MMELLLLEIGRRVLHIRRPTGGGNPYIMTQSDM